MNTFTLSIEEAREVQSLLTELNRPLSGPLVDLLKRLSRPQVLYAERKS